MNTQELRQRMVSDFACIGYDVTKDEGISVFFDDIESNRGEGQYFFVRDGSAYRGSIERNQRWLSPAYDDVTALLYGIYVVEAFLMARDFVRYHNTGMISPQRIMRIKQLELLARLDVAYYEKCLARNIVLIKEDLELYNDNLGVELDVSLLESLIPKNIDTNKQLQLLKSDPYYDITSRELPMRLDTYNEKGRFLYPAGTPFEQRSLPPTVLFGEYHVYEIRKQFGIHSGKIAPWFDQPGGGTQYYVAENLNPHNPEDEVHIAWLADNGYLVEIF